MRDVRLLIGLLVLLLLPLACGSAVESGSGIQAEVAQPVPQAAVQKPYILDGELTVLAFQKDREVVADSDQTFEFLLANHTRADLPVRLVLEHREGVRWRTSLCIGQQCILGDGSEPSVTEAVVLPPFLEQSFQAHIFVDPEATAGQEAALTLRVEPLVEDMEARTVSLSAVVAAR